MRPSRSIFSRGLPGELLLTCRVRPHRRSRVIILSTPRGEVGDGFESGLRSNMRSTKRTLSRFNYRRERCFDAHLRRCQGTRGGENGRTFRRGRRKMAHCRATSKWAMVLTSFPSTVMTLSPICNRGSPFDSLWR